MSEEKKNVVSKTYETKKISTTTYLKKDGSSGSDSGRVPHAVDLSGGFAAPPVSAALSNLTGTVPVPAAVPAIVPVAPPVAATTTTQSGGED